MCDANLLLAESREALGKVWFLRSLEVTDRTDSTLSLRLKQNRCQTYTFDKMTFFDRLCFE